MKQTPMNSNKKFCKFWQVFQGILWIDKTTQSFPDKVQVNQELGKNNPKKIHYDYKQFWLNSSSYEDTIIFMIFGLLLVNRESSLVRTTYPFLEKCQNFENFFHFNSNRSDSSQTPTLVKMAHAYNHLF